MILTFLAAANTGTTHQSGWGSSNQHQQPQQPQQQQQQQQQRNNFYQNYGNQNKPASQSGWSGYGQQQGKDWSSQQSQYNQQQVSLFCLLLRVSCGFMLGFYLYFFSVCFEYSSFFEKHTMRQKK